MESNGLQEIYVNATIDDGSDVAELMKILNFEVVRAAIDLRLQENNMNIFIRNVVRRNSFAGGFGRSLFPKCSADIFGWLGWGAL